MAKRRFKKRTFKKRAFKKYTKKRSMGKKADGGYLEKVSSHHQMVVQAGSASFVVNWLNTGASGNNEAFHTGVGIAGTIQFAQCQGMFREYKITSVKIVYRPALLNSGILVTSQAPMLSGTSMNTGGPWPLNTDFYKSALDTKKYRADQGISRFYRIGKYAASKKIGWRLTDDATTVGFTGNLNCQSAFSCTTVGWINGTVIGEFDVLYYIRFRYRKAA